MINKEVMINRYNIIKIVVIITLETKIILSWTINNMRIK